MVSISHPCRTIQGSVRHPSLMTIQALRKVSICDEVRQYWQHYCTVLYSTGSTGNPGSTVQALRGVYIFDQAVLLLPCWTNNHCPRPGLNVVIKHYWPSFLLPL